MARVVNIYELQGACRSPPPQPENHLFLSQANRRKQKIEMSLQPPHFATKKATNRKSTEYRHGRLAFVESWLMDASCHEFIYCRHSTKTVQSIDKKYNKAAQENFQHHGCSMSLLNLGKSLSGRLSIYIYISTASRAVCRQGRSAHCEREQSGVGTSHYQPALCYD